MTRKAREMARHFVDDRGEYLGEFAEGNEPEGAVQVPTPPPADDATWIGSRWNIPTKHFVDVDGAYIGAFGNGAVPPEDALQAPSAPPRGDARLVEDEWLVPGPAAADVDAEVSRRIWAVFGVSSYEAAMVAQANLTGEALMINLRLPTMPEEEVEAAQKRLSVIMGAYEDVAAVRAAGKVLRDETPEDYQDDKHWPSVREVES